MLASVSLPRTPARAAPNSDAINKYVAEGTGVVVLKRGKARYFREARSIMVYSGAVASVIPPSNGTLASSDPVVVVDGAHDMVGYGLYNATSMFRVRLLRHGAVHSVDIARDVAHHIRNAFTLRTTLGLPNSETTAFRAINGEGDRLSGLVVDVYNNVLVVSSSAQWVERYRTIIENALYEAVPHASRLIWRPSSARLRQDGYDDTASVDANATNSDGNGLIVLENGVKYSLTEEALTTGQKTGHYSDQRDVRNFLRRMLTARGGQARVLDLFSYSGGFALSAALAGAQVTCVDSSESALGLAAVNAALNGVTERIELVQSDVSKYLKTQEDKKYDIIICDPPKLAPNTKALQKATRKYRALNANALRRLENGGLLLTCSCSAAVARSGDLFIDTIRQAASDAHRDITLVKKFGSSCDHPVHPTSLDGDYLSVCLFSCNVID